MYLQYIEIIMHCNLYQKKVAKLIQLVSRDDLITVDAVV